MPIYNNFSLILFPLDKMMNLMLEIFILIVIMNKIGSGEHFDLGIETSQNDPRIDQRDSIKRANHQGLVTISLLDNSEEDLEIYKKFVGSPIRVMNHKSLREEAKSIATESSNSHSELKLSTQKTLSSKNSIDSLESHHYHHHTESKFPTPNNRPILDTNRTDSSRKSSHKKIKSIPKENAIKLESWSIPLMIGSGLLSIISFAIFRTFKK